ncbi:MAG: hypothetical protein ABWY22_02005 [Flavobacterium sp.]
MIQKVLENIAHLFYPTSICAWKEREKYVASEEYKRLRFVIDSFDTNKFSSMLKTEFDRDATLKDFQDLTQFDSMEDRCFTFLLTLIEDGELKSINLYISILVPYYVIQTITHTKQILISQSKMDDIERSKLDVRKIDELVLEVEKIIENKLSYQKFPKELLNVVIEDISFQDAYQGEFKMFNAFFNNQSATHE